MKKRLLSLIFVLVSFSSCGRDSPMPEEILELTEYVSQTYELYYEEINSKYRISGAVQVEGAGLHLKINSLDLKRGYLFMVLHNTSKCGLQNQRKNTMMWKLNNNFSQNAEFENGFPLVEGKVKESFDFYLLMRFLKRPKRNYSSLREGEKLSLELRTLWFYYSSQSYVKKDELILLGCAEFHST